jgi:2-iminobutanoate/2-iminopropanoate deaminase
MGKIRRVIVSTPLAPAAIGPYNQAVLVGQTLYISGQLGLDPVTMKLVPGGVVAEAARALKNMELVLKKAKLGFKVHKQNCLLTESSLYNKTVSSGRDQDYHPDGGHGRL